MMDSRNEHLTKRFATSNNDYFTLMCDVEKAMDKFKEDFRGKSIYCPADDLSSNFFKFFYKNFRKFGLKHLTITSYNRYTRGRRYDYDGKVLKPSLMKSNGDIHGEEVLDIMKENDYVITNPPFKGIVLLIKKLMDNGIKFYLFAPTTCLSNRYIVEGYRDYQLYFDDDFFDKNMLFRSYDGKKEISITTVNNIKDTFTVIDYNFDKKYDKEKYQQIDDLDFPIPVVNRTKDIPNYAGIMAVPVTAIKYLNRDKWEIKGLLQYMSGKHQHYFVKGKKLFVKLLIKSK